MKKIIDSAESCWRPKPWSEEADIFLTANSVEQQTSFAKQLLVNSLNIQLFEFGTKEFCMELIQRIISQHPMAKGLSRNQLSVLAECATCSFFDKGKIIFSEGDSAQNFYLVQSGKVALELNIEEEPAQIDIIEAGSLLGWAWMFPPYYWHFDARATEPTQVISFYGKRLREECERDHVLGYHLANYMANLVIQRLQKTRLQLLQHPMATPKAFSALVPN